MNRRYRELRLKYVKDGTFEKFTNILQRLKSQCQNSNFPTYDKYGGAGITICQEWRHNYDFFSSIVTVEGYDKEKLLNKKITLKLKPGAKVFSPTTTHFVPTKGSQLDRREAKVSRRGRRPLLKQSLNLDTGEIVEFYNVEERAEELNIHPSSIYACLTNHNYSNNGWVYRYFGDKDTLLDKANSAEPMYEFIDPNGKKHYTRKRKSFCHAHELNPSMVSRIINYHPNYTVMGWKVREIKYEQYLDIS